MSEASEAEKTEEATPKRREEAREKGQIPRSVELNAAMMLLGSALVINALGPALGGTLLSTFQYGIIVAGAGPLDGESAVGLVRGMGWKVLAALGTFVAAMAGVTLTIAAAQGRGILSTKALEPQWNRMNPLTNFQRLVGVQPWVDLVKSLAKLAIVAFAVHSSLKSAWDDAMTLSLTSPFGMLELVKRYSVKLLMTAGLAYLALAAMDYLYQMWQHEKSLRMTKEEVKLEHKQNEGDPLVKARMRAMGRAMARRQMFTDVPKADVVITNPTHIAVALKYDPQKSDAPVVLAMGQRKIAQHIKALAAEAGVPMIENRPLARALLGSARVGDAIPAELYVAVAEVLAFVIRERRAGRTTWSGSAHA
jgi:flagellar biosynthesis protein FlhB